jgi:uncharacterized membrane-anchored protein
MSTPVPPAAPGSPSAPPPAAPPPPAGPAAPLPPPAAPVAPVPPAGAPHPVSRRRFLVAAAVQIVALVGLVAWKGSIFVTEGPTVVLRTVPVDPRSLFMGDYVALRYALSTLRPEDGVDADRWDLPAGAAAFVVLEEAGDGTWRAVRLAAERPLQDASRPFVAGVVDRCAPEAGCTLTYGIEQYYVPEHRGPALEEAARHGDVLVTVKLDLLGRAGFVALHYPGE